MNLNLHDGILLSAELSEHETELVIPEGVVALGPASLAMKRWLRKVTLPETLNQIGPAAFSGCTGLEALALYEWVFVGSDAFGRCDSLRFLEVFGRKRKSKKTGLGVRFIPRLPMLREALLHEGVSDVSHYAFSNCTRLEKVVLPSTLRQIKKGAFYGCTALRQIDLPATISIIEDEAFENCTALEQVDLPESLIDIGDEVFTGCSSLKSVTVPPGVKRICGNTFQGCTALVSVTMSPEISGRFPS